MVESVLPMAVRAISNKNLIFMNELSFIFINYALFKPQAPVAQNIANEVVLDVSKVNESSFF